MNLKDIDEDFEYAGDDIELEPECGGDHDWEDVGDHMGCTYNNCYVIRGKDDKGYDE